MFGVQCRVACREVRFWSMHCLVGMVVHGGALCMVALCRVAC